MTFFPNHYFELYLSQNFEEISLFQSKTYKLPSSFRYH